MARPPIKDCRTKAVKALIAAHHDEYQELVDAELAKAGWSQEVVEVKKWTQAQA